VQEGALADLILVNSDPLANIDLIADPSRTFTVVVKDGVVVKRAP
jgi:imidazolonepropionase-like amidohydrolase